MDGLAAVLGNLREQIELEAAALKKVVVDNFSPSYSTAAIDMNRALLEVETIASRLEHLSLHIMDLVGPRTDPHGVVGSSSVQRAGALDEDGSNDVDPDDVIPMDYVSPLNVDSQASSDMPRLIGRNATKVARSRGASSSGSRGTVSSGLYATHLEELNVTKARMADLKREQLDMMREADEERIMKIDVESRTGPLKEYYKRRQEDILGKWSARPRAD